MPHMRHCCLRTGRTFATPYATPHHRRLLWTVSMLLWCRAAPRARHTVAWLLFAACLLRGFGSPLIGLRFTATHCNLHWFAYHACHLVPSACVAVFACCLFLFCCAPHQLPPSCLLLVLLSVLYRFLLRSSAPATAHATVVRRVHRTGFCCLPAYGYAFSCVLLYYAVFVAFLFLGLLCSSPCLPAAPPARVPLHNRRAAVRTPGLFCARAWLCSAFCAVLRLLPPTAFCTGFLFCASRATSVPLVLFAFSTGILTLVLHAAAGFLRAWLRAPFRIILFSWFCGGSPPTSDYTIPITYILDHYCRRFLRSSLHTVSFAVGFSSLHTCPAFPAVPITICFIFYCWLVQHCPATSSSFGSLPLPATTFITL